MTQTITKIESQKRQGRFNVYVDGAYAFPVSEEVLIKYRLFKGMEVDELLINQLKKADDVSKLHSRALDFLAHHLRTDHEVREKLAEITEDSNAIDSVIAKLRRQRLIDDRKYADSYVRTVVREAKNGPDWIRRHLKDKRVKADLIEASLVQYYPEATAIEIGAEVAQKQLSHHKHDSAKMAINKTKNLLMRRGFNFSLIDEIMNEVNTSELVVHDQEIINQLAEKYWRKYAKYDSYEQKQKTKQALYRKGFLLDDIEAVLAQLSES